jgi:hypothetical protein
VIRGGEDQQKAARAALNAISMTKSDGILAPGFVLGEIALGVHLFAGGFSPPSVPVRVASSTCRRCRCAALGQISAHYPRYFCHRATIYCDFTGMGYVART